MIAFDRSGRPAKVKKGEKAKRRMRRRVSLLYDFHAASREDRREDHGLFRHRGRISTDRCNQNGPLRLYFVVITSGWEKGIEKGKSRKRKKGSARPSPRAKGKGSVYLNSFWAQPPCIALLGSADPQPLSPFPFPPPSHFSHTLSSW